MSPKEMEYKFTVAFADRPYDVYRFVKEGKAGTLAFTRRLRPEDAEEKFEIAVMCRGDLSEAEVLEKLRLQLQ